MKSDKTTTNVTCPKCGRKAELRVCLACTKIGSFTPLFSRNMCPACKGKGVVIYCDACETRQKQMSQAAMKAERDKALSRNPFLPYYDKDFR